MNKAAMCMLARKSRYKPARLIGFLFIWTANIIYYVDAKIRSFRIN